MGLGPEGVSIDEVWHRDGARREFTGAVTHLIVSGDSSREVLERTIHFKPNAEDWHVSFADDAIGSEALRHFGILVFDCYLVML